MIILPDKPVELGGAESTQSLRRARLGALVPESLRGATKFRQMDIVMGRRVEPSMNLVEHLRAEGFDVDEYVSRSRHDREHGDGRSEARKYLSRYLKGGGDRGQGVHEELVHEDVSP